MIRCACVAGTAAFSVRGALSAVAGGQAQRLRVQRGPVRAEFRKWKAAEEKRAREELAQREGGSASERGDERDSSSDEDTDDGSSRSSSDKSSALENGRSHGSSATSRSKPNGRADADADSSTISFLFWKELGLPPPPADTGRAGRRQLLEWQRRYQRAEEEQRRGLRLGGALARVCRGAAM